MSDDPRQTDLFAEEAPRQTLMFDEPAYQPPKPVHTKESIRALLTGLIEELRGYETLPWDGRTLRGHRAMAPYMAEWLKDGEGDRLLAEFRAELVRLGADPIQPRAKV